MNKTIPQSCSEEDVVEEDEDEVKQCAVCLVDSLLCFNINLKSINTIPVHFYSISPETYKLFETSVT